jgi:XTP/dITP diphosphohydrolase
MGRIRIVLATRNEDKVRELRAILADLPVEIVSATEFRDLPPVEENGATLEENALLKARAVHRFLGLPALADDTGLEVDALGGRPGVYSSRFAGEQATYEDNVRKLLEELKDVPDGRTARFRCVAAFVDGETELLAEGVCEGQILHEPRGTGGFGYDPVFYVPEKGKTFAEMTLEEKNRISHRSRAFQRMKELLEQYLRRDKR